MCNLKRSSFHHIAIQEMFDQLIKLDPKKASPEEAIPPKILQENANLFSSSLTELFNKILVESTFPDDLKLADIPLISRHFLEHQSIDYISAFQSQFLGGFRKWCKTEHVLVNFLQTCKASIDKGTGWSNNNVPF